MSLPQTEMTPTQGNCIDAMSHVDAVSALVDGQISALSAVKAATPQIVAAAHLFADTVRVGGRLTYVAAGSSGLMALADGAELPGTFGIPQEQIRILMAGGVPIDGKMPGDTEDDIAQADTLSGSIDPKDLIIAISASGTTPFPLEIARHAKVKGVKIVALANNAATPLLEIADVAVALETPAEILAGSTRLGAGTAQKAALNAMSTLAGVLLGHVHDGLMVNLLADNAKLRTRASGIVAQIADVPKAAAEAALSAANGNAKRAILLAKDCTIEAADALLREHDGHLRPCLANLSDQSEN